MSCLNIETAQHKELTEEEEYIESFDYNEDKGLLLLTSNTNQPQTLKVRHSKHPDKVIHSSQVGLLNTKNFIAPKIVEWKNKKTIQFLASFTKQTTCEVIQQAFHHY